ncbi:hypothetical protein BKA58DRAFT_11699 [Alternaria rosae]|uniref:uncharacterized protein n=1 Tax=Alternaria rosae TaxID=1187941 RepID=UPI001E8D2111|nr:uncharacterized protein BKA58DRAFT_11699 [Alternaria rosae]KAH6882006.1 hypothetical protein BKA58DRAFT_11699 [Alternaria rosae]
MQQLRSAFSPLPDIVRGPSAPPRLPPRPSPPPPAPDFLVIGLFALRLTKRLIESLEYYPGRDADIIWLVNFLSPFHNDGELAKISGARRDDYLATYHSIVSRMKKQPEYPMRFMQMNPDQSSQPARWRSKMERPREMTDAERLEIVNFCDAAGEWGSILPIPAREAERMIELADRRRIVDLDEHDRQRLQYEDREGSRDCMQSRSEDREELLDRRPSRFEPHSLPYDTRRPLQKVRQPEREDRYRLNNAGVWRGDEYLSPNERQQPVDTRRRRRVSFADNRQYFEDERR